MDIANDDPLEFLDFTGVDESEKNWILSSLHSTNSYHKLPWIITQIVPSKKLSKYDRKKKSSNPQHYDMPPDQNQTNSSNVLIAAPYHHHHHQGQLQHLNMAPKFITPVPFTYPGAVVPIPPICTNFPHTVGNNSPTLINPVIYSPDPSYPYAQVSPVPPAIETNAFQHQMRHVVPVPLNVVQTQQQQQQIFNGGAPVTIHNQPSPQNALHNNMPTFAQPARAGHAPVLSPAPLIAADPPSRTEVENVAIVNNNNNIDNDSNNEKSREVVKETASVAPVVPTVSYGVPTGSPFPGSREPKNNNSVVVKQNGQRKCSKTDDLEIGVVVVDTNVADDGGNDGKVEKSEVMVDGFNDANVGGGGATATAATAVSAAPSSVKSWASLFRGSEKGAQSQYVDGSDRNAMSLDYHGKEMENGGVVSPVRNARKGQFADPTCYRMAEYLLGYSVDGRTISLQPRGLINRSNYCYINSILQALLACPPLYNLMKGLAKNETTGSEKRKPTPFIDSLCKLVNEFDHLPAGQRVGRRTEKNQKKEAGTAVNCGTPFEPSWIYKMLNGVRSDSFLVEGRQEDAEEFFGCLLNGLNDEMQELMKLVKNEVEEITDVSQTEQETNDWQVMGPKNKCSITRKTIFGKTPVSDIFGGLLSSKIHRAGDESTNNIQPFFTLQLNIEKAKTVSEALEALATKNQLEGVTSSKTNEQVEAWQQVMIEELPVVLVLHLKCFDYQLNGCTKIMKTLEFPIDLKIDSKLLSSKLNSSKEKQFKLFAVVYHDGKEASKGHYITDAFHVGYNSWLRYDDASVKAVSEEQVLSPQGCRVPYLLFYRRCDTIRSK